MKTSLIKAYQIAPAKLWEILTSPHYSKKYMFNCVVTSGWQKGDSIVWEGEYQGYKAFQKGEILSIEVEKSVVYTTFDPNFGMEDIPENYIHITYLLEQQGDKTQFTVTNETFDGKAERMQHIKEGWEQVLEKIEEIVSEIT